MAQVDVKASLIFCVYTWKLGAKEIIACCETSSAWEIEHCLPQWLEVKLLFVGECYIALLDGAQCRGQPMIRHLHFDFFVHVHACSCWSSAALLPFKCLVFVTNDVLVL